MFTPFKKALKQRSINTISFVGNKAYSNTRLERIISTKKSGYFSFGGVDIYNENKLRFDENAIRQFYYNRGYAGIKVSSQAILDTKKNLYDLIFKIDEGGIYRVGNVTIRSSLEEAQDEKLLRLIQAKSGAVYNPQWIEKTINNISKYFLSIGKSFVRVDSRINRDVAQGIVDVEYLLDQDSPVYIARIEIEGNDVSHDFVIRRELGFSEGDPINAMMIERAKRRIKNTGFFSEVNVFQLPTDVPDRVVLKVHVKQLSSTSISISLSYGSNKNFPNLEGYFSDNNLFGRGYKQSIALSLINKAYSFENPYFFGSRIAAGFDRSLSPTIKWKVLAEQEFFIPCLEKQIELTRLFKAAAKVDLISSDLLASAELLYSKLRDTLFSELNIANLEKDNALKAHKKGLIQQLFSSFSSEVEWKTLGEIGYYSDTRINASELDCTTFVGVDNLLKNTKGKIDSSYVPTVNKLTSYKIGDILLSKIRPYFKKIWLANNNGGCSGAVLAIRIKNQFRHEIVSKFLYYCLASDIYFTYNMRYVQGSIMPLSNKKDILKFSIPIPPIEIQREIVSQLDSVFECVVSAEKRCKINSLLKMRIISDSLKNY